jgi:hypothetical protein
VGRAARGDGQARVVPRGWALQWTPQLAIAVIESSRYGTTVEVAADTMVRERATAASSLADLTALARGALLADLPRAAARSSPRCRSAPRPAPTSSS